MKKYAYIITLILNSPLYVYAMENNTFQPLIDLRNNHQLLEVISKGIRNYIPTLLEQKVDVNFQTPYGNSPLNMALLTNNINILDLLAKNGANPHVSVVHYTGNAKIKPLSKKWALEDISILDSLEKQYADLLEENNTQLKSVIEKFKKAEQTGYYTAGLSLIEAVEKNETKRVRKMLAAKADPNFTNKFGNSPLNAAVHHQHIPIIKILVEADASVHHNACIITIPNDTTILYSRSTLSILKYQHQLYYQAEKNNMQNIDTLRNIIFALGAMIPVIKKKKVKAVNKF